MFRLRQQNYSLRSWTENVLDISGIQQSGDYQMIVINAILSVHGL